MPIEGRILSIARCFALSLVCVAALTSRAVAAPVYQETFDAPATNLSRWAVIQSGGPTVQQENGKAVVRFPADSVGSTFFSGYDSVPWLHGDFDIQVDYSLPTWPSRPGVRVALSLAARDGSGGALVERVGWGEGEGENLDPNVYLVDFPEGVSGIVGTTDLSGTLRLVRTGGLLTAYFRSTPTAEWVLIHSGPGPTADVGFGFRAWSHDPVFVDQPVVVAFDNYRVTKGKLILPVTPEGLKSPLAELVPNGESVPLPPRAFRRSQVLPLKLQLLFGGVSVTASQVSAPKIVGLLRNGVPVNLSGLDLDDGKYNRNGLNFRSVGKSWVYRLRARALKKGTFTVIIQMPDGKSYAAGFVLR